MSKKGLCFLVISIAVLALTARIFCIEGVQTNLKEAVTTNTDWNSPKPHEDARTNVNSNPAITQIANYSGSAAIPHLTFPPSSDDKLGAPLSVKGYRSEGSYPGSDSLAFTPSVLKTPINAATFPSTNKSTTSNPIITTVAGNGWWTYGGDGGPAIQAQLNSPRGIAIDSSKNLYIADTDNHRIRRVDKKGIITTLAGNGDYGYAGDNNPAIHARLYNPSDIVFDKAGNLYIADTGNHCIRRVDKQGIITLVAGHPPVGGYWGDEGPATQVNLYYPSGVAIDSLGNLYIADTCNHRIRKVDKDGMISTVAGSGSGGSYGGDGGYATEARLNNPSGVTFDTSGNLYIADSSNHRIRKVDRYGIITTVAGNGTRGHSGDGGRATEAQLGYLAHLVVDAMGNLYIADEYNECIRKVDTNGIITTIAGNGLRGYAGDNGLATQCQLNSPEGLARDALGHLYIADTRNSLIRKVDTNGFITTVAGSQNQGDGGPATEATLCEPSGVSADLWGNFYIADKYNHRIRKIDETGIITTVAGVGKPGYTGDGGPAIQAQLYHPTGVTVDPLGNFYVADKDNRVIRKIDAEGIISTVAGTGEGGYGGDGGLATQARLYPTALALDSLGDIYIADKWNDRVRRLDRHGIITTVAGKGVSGYSGDGGPATEAELCEPSGVAIDTIGNLYIADTCNYRIRRVDTNGMISTVAGTGEFGYSGDGGPAIQATIGSLYGLALDIQGNLFFTDSYHNLIRKVDTEGIITTVAGGGDPPDGLGDGGFATQASLDIPLDVTVDAWGSLYIADSLNDRIRKVEDVFVIQKATVTGTVTDSSTNLPLSDVMATVRDSHATLEAKTDSNGKFTVPALTEGPFTAAFEKSGYAKQEVTGALMAGQTQTLQIRLNPIPPLALYITSPQDGSKINSSPVTVLGITSNDANVRVNDIQVALRDKSFSLSIPLKEGENIITAKATDQFGQTASHTISVALVIKASMTGTVTDLSSGLPLSSATVSMRDALNKTRTVSTNRRGEYRIVKIPPGLFNGSIAKNGYKTFNFSGVLAPGQAFTVNAVLSPLLPIDDIAVTNITADSATIAWKTTQPSDSLVEYGPTSSYGDSVRDTSLTKNHRIKLRSLSPATTYHFKVTSKDRTGVSLSSEDSQFTTLDPPGPITINITFPKNGGVITRPDTRVEGTFANSTGRETGIVVDETVANVYGNRFFLNHVPLMEGSNTIVATATDANVNTATARVTVNSIPGGDYVEITSNIEAGISPLETILTITSSLDPDNARLTYEGPGQVEFLSKVTGEYRVRIVAPGIYTFTGEIPVSKRKSYTDAVSIMVLPRSELDHLLRIKWEGMRAKLAESDIEGALVFFDESSRQDYRELFNVLSPMLPVIAQEMSDIELIEFVKNTAIYDLRTVRDGKEYSFQLLFRKDSNGLWSISSF
jgi:sugar lactone lactonase YvrE